MHWLWKVLFVVMAIGLASWLYQTIRSRPEAFSRANLGRSVYTLGWLALFLIGVIALMVVLLRT